MKLTYLDILVIILYFLLILFLGFKAKSKGNIINDENFLLAGRKLTLPFFVASLVATWYGNILGIGEFLYKSGIVAWICFGIPYYISAFLFSMFFANKIRNFGFKSIPEQISNKFGNKAGFLSSIIILLITLPAAYLLMLGELFQLFSGYSLNLSIILITILSLIYLFWGGFKADIWTNSAQFILMYLGFGILLFFSIYTLGSINGMMKLLPKSHLTFFGNRNIQYVVSWFIISLQTFVDPSFHQRCAASNNSKIAKKGILISICFWILFDFLTLITGLYAKSYINLSDPLQAYPALAELILPSFWKGIFIVSMLSVIMSTLDSYAFISAITIGNDIIGKYLKNITRSITFYTRVGLLITSVFSVFIAIMIPSAIDIIYKTSSIAIPGLLFPVIISYSKSWTIKEKFVLPSILVPSIISFLWVVLNSFPSHYSHLFSSIEPMFPGILISLFFGIFIIQKKFNVK